MPELGRVEADSPDQVPEWERLLERCHRGVRAQMAQETQNEAPGDAPPALPIFKCTADAGDHRIERNTPVGVRLRIKEDFGVGDALGGGPPEIGGCQLVEVPLGDEHRASGVVDVEERLKVVEDVSAPDGFDVCVGQ